MDEWNAIQPSVEVIIVDGNCCNDGSLVLLDLSAFADLRVFEVGDFSFMHVGEVRMIGMKQLERVAIGKNCMRVNCEKGVSDRGFYLKDCHRMRELKMGAWSFSDYTVCEIENLPSLEVIEMGDLIEDSHNFMFASQLILESWPDRM